MHTRLWCESLKERYHLGNLAAEGRMMLKWILRIQEERAWAKFIWLRIGTSEGLLWKRGRTVTFHKIQGIS